MAEIGRRKGEFENLMGAVNGDTLGIVGNAWKVQMDHGSAPAARKGKRELNSATVIEESSAVGFRRQRAAEMGENSMYHGNVMDKGGEKAIGERTTARLIEVATGGLG
jgi:hypothetical protein